MACEVRTVEVVSRPKVDAATQTSEDEDDVVNNVREFAAWQQCPRCDRGPTEDNWKDMEKELHMLRCDPCFFRDELQSSHSFQVLVAKAGIKWVFRGAKRPRSEMQTDFRRRLVEAQNQASELGIWATVERESTLAEADQDPNTPPTRGRRRTPVKIGAKTVKSPAQEMDCACGIQLPVGNCVQCEHCNLWFHRFCEGLKYPTFDKVRRASTGFFCHRCAKEPSVWSNWKEWIAGQRTSYSSEAIIKQLYSEASDTERQFLKDV